MASTNSRGWRIGGGVLVLIVMTVIGWWAYFRPSSLVGFVSSNGRLEAEEIDIATKFHGRVAVVLVDEGDTVEAGQVVARMDTQSLDAQLRQATARVKQTEKERQHAAAVIQQRESECTLAEKELGRSRTIYKEDRGAISEEHLDRNLAAVQTAQALCAAAEAQLAEAEAAIVAAIAETERVKADLLDCELTTPRGGRVLYRLAEPGEVLAAGGKVLTIIDLEDMYMTVFFGEREAGQIPIGARARIVLDALPDRPIPSTVSFVAAKAQFTPKEVETTTERQKLVFRVKAQVLDANDSRLKPGMPGMAYVRVVDSAEWPEQLQ